MFFFFFSSRRRHTRCLSDWSSDVCSSDLSTMRIFSSAEYCFRVARRMSRTSFSGVPAAETDRSEERRVGKECRSRWWPGREKEKEYTNVQYDSSITSQVRRHQTISGKSSR